jgi:Leucine-rich repeat (LRR) protein
LNLKNGNNSKILKNHGIYFRYFTGYLGLGYGSSFKNSISLNCIQVDNVDYSDINWSSLKEDYAYFSSLDCGLSTQIVDPKFEDKLIVLGIDTDGKNSAVLNTSIANITSLDVSNSTITNLSGIQGFLALQNLNCSNNNLFESINLSKNTALTTLNCATNSSLICIQVADVAYANANWAITKDAIANFNIDCNVYTLIPDPKFEDKLITLGIDRDGRNGKVLTKSITTLTSLNVSSSSITDLTGIQDFVALTNLICNFNQLTRLDFSKNIALTNLECYSNNLNSIDISKNMFLNRLDCSANKLVNLDVSKNVALTDLICRGNLLTTIDISKNVNLGYILISDNKLTTFETSNNTKLYQIWCQNNKITTLDFSKNSLLTQVLCNNNELINLNIKNGKNSAISKGNPNLICIQVDDVVYANTNWAAKKDSQAFYNSLECIASTIIVDPKFEDKLITLGIDTDGKNGAVLNTSIATITSLDVSNSEIKNLIGVQGFLALQNLNCSNNLLENIDLTKNIALKYVICSNNRLTSLNVSKNIDLLALSCETNLLTGLDVSKNIALITLAFDENQLTSLDVSKNINLKRLYGQFNKLTNLDLSNNNILNTLTINENQINSLNISKNSKLTELFCSKNRLTNLDISKNIDLYSLYCDNNQLNRLDISNNINLTELICSKNQLTELNLKNGKNNQLTNIDLTSNPILTCILVDNVTYSNTNWTSYKDATAEYATDCTFTLIPDSNFEDKLIDIGIDTDGKNGKVLTSSINAQIDLDVRSSAIKDLTGIQDFVALKILVCSDNMLTNLDISKNISLSSLFCDGNLLTNIDISKNVNLNYLVCYKNQLSSLDTSKNLVLSHLSCGANLLASLDISSNKALKELYCDKNQLTNLNAKNGSNDKITTFFVINNPLLSCIQVDDVSYADVNFVFKDNTAKFSLDCNALPIIYTTIPDTKFEDKLIALGIDKDGKNGKVKTTSIAYLKTINLQLAEITDLTGIQDFKELEILDCGINSLTKLDVSQNLKLTDLYCHFNLLTSLDISKNTLIKVLQCNKNKIKSFDASKNIVLADINIKDNDLISLNLKNGNNSNAVSYIMSSNPKLTCIEVDNVAFSNSSAAFYKDASAIYSAVSCVKLGVDDQIFNKIKIYPIPAKSILHVDNIVLEKATVYNTLGKLVKTSTFVSGATNNSINLSGIPKGVYFVYLQSEGSTIVKRILMD